ncbi:serine hydrolase domain-containing protein [Fusibacter bizertensis]|uniref:Serine hydrolase domain-containing protein n=1 Tax=Fusibacter bizertensis TaxID=1488331 RepID=A0ABT6N8Y8_9FIRM|nr:serine hydrolase domain-containing protein [Fusibacter bizertensis]MDH8676881.1 serine hydrolase domain-containing protein [Fusibacter bizertensis]
MGILTDFRLTAIEQNLGLYGIHVYQHGKTIAEHRFRSDDRENLYSASKTVVAIAVGIAELENLLTVDDYVLDFFPDYKSIASEGSDQIKIVHLLKMSSGHISETYEKYNDMDRVKLFFLEELLEKPGSKFYYEDLCTYMLGRIIHKLSGENLLDYLKTRLFDKLGIVNPQWHTCQNGFTACSGGLYLKTEEFSRIGVLLLGKGTYDGHKIVSSGYVERMHSSWIDTSYKLDPESRQGYGYQVWKSTLPNCYRADGMYGQYCIILEDYDAVITVTGHNEEYPKEVLRAIWKDIVPNLG